MDDARSFKNEFDEFDGVALSSSHTQNKLDQERSCSILETIHKLFKVLSDNFDGSERNYSIYTGQTGFVLLNLHMHSKLPGVSDDRYLRNARRALEPCLSRLKRSRVSFLNGDAGPLALAAVIFNMLGDKSRSREYIKKVMIMCEDVCQDRDLPDEILYGRCGYLSALLFLQQHLGHGCIDKSIITQVVESILASGEALSRRLHCSHPLMYEWHDKAYLGAAHGLAGIYFMLLQVSEPSIQERIRVQVKPCIDYMLTLRFASGNCPSSINSSNGDKLVHWCHGAPGWVHMFVLAHKIYKEKRYLQAAKDCAKVVWKRGLLRKGYGLCHGVAGNAYTFLTLYKHTEDQRYLYYAYKFAEWCCDYGKHGCRTPDTPYSLFEGMAGTVYFLVDILDPVKSAFPAFDFQTSS